MAIDIDALRKREQKKQEAPINQERYATLDSYYQRNTIPKKAQEYISGVADYNDQYNRWLQETSRNVDSVEQGLQKLQNPQPVPANIYNAYVPDSTADEWASKKNAAYNSDNRKYYEMMAQRTGGDTKALDNLGKASSDSLNALRDRSKQYYDAASPSRVEQDAVRQMYGDKADDILTAAQSANAQKNYYNDQIAYLNRQQEDKANKEKYSNEKIYALQKELEKIRNSDSGDTYAQIRARQIEDELADAQAYRAEQERNNSVYYQAQQEALAEEHKRYNERWKQMTAAEQAAETVAKSGQGFLMSLADGAVGLWDMLDVLNLGKDIQDEARKGISRFELENSWNAQAMENSYGAVGKYTKMFSDLMPQVASNLAMAYVTGGAGAASGAGILNKIKDFARSPMFWTTFAQEGGAAYNDAIESGADDLTASIALLLTGLPNAAIEIGDGFLGLGGGIESIPNNVAKTWKEQFKNLAKTTWEEASEEVRQDFVSKLVEKLTYAPELELYSWGGDGIIDPMRALESAIGGAMGGLAGGVISSPVQLNGMYNIQNAEKAQKDSIVSRFVQNDNYFNKFGDLVNDYSLDTKETAKLKKTYDDIAKRRADGQKISADEYFELYKKAEEALNNDVKGNFFEALQAMGIEDEAMQLSEALRKSRLNIELTEQDVNRLMSVDDIRRQIVRNSKTANPTVQDVLDQQGLVQAVANAIYDNFSPIASLNERVAMQDANALMQKLQSDAKEQFEKEVSSINAANTAIRLMSVDNKNDIKENQSDSVTYNGKEFKVNSYDTSNNESYAVLSDGNKVKASDITYASKSSQALAENASDYNGKLADIYVKGYQPSLSVGEYTNWFNRFYNGGRTGMSETTAVNSARQLSQYANPDVMMEAYRAGVQSKASEDTAYAEANKRRAEKQNRSEGKAVIEADVNKTEKAFAKMIAKKTGYSIKVINDESNKSQGQFDSTASEIVINIANGNFYATAMHELTHFIELNSPKAYSEFKTAVIEWLADRGELESEFAKIGKSYGELYDNINDMSSEIVANAAEALLKSDDFAEKLFGNQDFVDYLYEENETVAQKIAHFFKELVDSLKQALKDIISGAELNHNIADRLSEDVEKLGKLADIWANALNNTEVEVESDTNFDAATATTYTEEAILQNNSNEANINVQPDGIPTKESNKATDEVIKNSLSTYLDRLAKVAKSFSANSEGEIKMANKTAALVSGRTVLLDTLKENNFSKKEISEIKAFMDDMADFMGDAQIRYTKIGLDDINKASIKVSYTETGKLLNASVSAMVKNGDYPVNFDFSTICKRRNAMTKLIRALVDKAKADSVDGNEYTVNLTQNNLWQINKTLSEMGYETACLGCFVESKRYNLKEWAESFVAKWNKAVDEYASAHNMSDVPYFDFSDIDITQAEDITNADIEAIEEVFDKTTKNIRSTIVTDSKGQIQSVSLNNEQKIKALLKSSENQGNALVKKLRISDLVTAQGIENLKRMSKTFTGILAGHYGSATPKMIQDFTAYNSEIALLPKSKTSKDENGNSTISARDYLYSIAGVRANSFSDFRIELVMDYLQMFEDCAARRFPMHAYTKEIWFAKLFGMTGAKINMSVMFNVLNDKYWAKHSDRFKELGVTTAKAAAKKYAGLYINAEGELDYLIADQKHIDKAKKLGIDNLYVQSINFDEAVKLQKAKGYTSNVGIIGVGYSYELVRRMLDDDRFRYVIPYHSSSLPVEIKNASNLKFANDFTGVQNTTRLYFAVDNNGRALTGEAAVDFYKTFVKEAYDRTGSWTKAFAEWNAHRSKSKKKFKANKVTGKHGAHADFDIYSEANRNKSAKDVCDDYIAYCVEEGLLPVFSEFADNENYYKLNFDFNVYDCVTGAYAPQTDVTHNYPSNFKELVDGYMSQQNSYNEQFESNVGNIVEDLDKNTNIIVKSSEYKMGKKKKENVSAHDAKVNNILNWKTSSDYDLKLSLPETETEMTDSDILTELKDSFKQELGLVRGAEIDDVAINAVARNLRKEYSVQIDAKEISDMLRQAFDAANKTSVDNAMIYFDYLAMSLLEKSQEYDTSTRDEYKEALDYIRKTKIKVSDKMKSEIAYTYGNYNDFRKHNFGSLSLSTADGIGIDQMYQKLVSDFGLGLYLPEDISDLDMMDAIVNFIQSTKPQLVNKYADTMQESAQYLALEIFSEYLSSAKIRGAKADISKAVSTARAKIKNAQMVSQEDYAARLADVKSKHKEQIADVAEKLNKLNRGEYSDVLSMMSEAVKAQIGLKNITADSISEANKVAMEAYYKDKLGQLKSKNAEKILEIRAKYEGKLKQKDDKYESDKLRKSIAERAEKLRKMIVENTDKLHIPESLKPVIGNFLESISFISERMEANAALGKPSEKYETFRKRMAELERELNKDYANPDGQSDLLESLDPDCVTRISNLIDGMSEFKVPTLTLTQLHELDTILKALAKAVNNANKLIANAKYSEIAKLGEATISDMKKAKTRNVAKVFEPIDKTLNFDMLDSRSYFEKLGEASTTVYDALRDGFDKRVQKLKIAENYIKNALEGHDITKWVGKNAETKTFKLESGENLTLTVGQIMELYELSQREQALNHIVKGGITPTEIEQKRKNIKQQRVLINNNDLIKITASLTEEQRTVANSLQKFLEKEAAKWGNEVTMQMYGYDKFGENHYYPIHSDDSFTKTSDSSEALQTASMYRLKNLGMTKNLVKNANNPIFVDDIMKTVVNHITDMANYNAYVIPLSDAMKWYNYKQKSDIESQNTVKKEMVRAYGNQSKRYFVKLIEDLNGVRGGDDGGLSDTLMSKWKAVSVAANVRVALQQPTAIGRAAVVISPKHLTKAVGIMASRIVGGKYKSTLDELYKYSPIAQWKGWGYYDTGIGKSMYEALTGITDARDKLLEGSMKLAEVGDSVTWAAIWEACKSQVKATTELEGEQLLKKAAELFDDCIDRTQVVDTPLHRSQIMRSKNAFAQMEMAFMAEPTKTYNLARNAIVNAVTHPSPKNAMQLGRTMASIATSSMLTALAAAISDAFRDTDKSKDWFEKYAENVWANLFDNINPLSMLPYAKDVVSILNGFSIDRPDLTAIKGATELVQKFVEGDLPMNANTAYKVMQYVSMFTGIPIYSFMREADTVIDIFGDPLFRNVNTKASQVLPRLYNAMLNGDDKRYNEMYALLLELGKTDSTIESSLRTQLRNPDSEIYEPRIKEAAEARANGNTSRYLELIDELTANGFGQDFWTKAVTAEYNKIISDGKEAEEQSVEPEQVEDLVSRFDGEAEESLFSSSDMSNAISKLDEDTFKVIYEDYKSKHSDTSTRSAVTRAAKPLVTEAYEDDYQQYVKLMNFLIDNCGYDRKTIVGWLNN